MTEHYRIAHFKTENIKTFNEKINKSIIVY